MAGADVDRARGTAWRIWDLHVHTPASIVQHYGGDTDETWARFIDDLEALPEDITVIGINDYWFLDGYKRVSDARKNGRLPNLEAVFPVIEMRLDHFGGTEGKLARVNLHVVFDPGLDADLIQAQFVGALQPKVKLSPSHTTLGWQGVITRESLIDLGHRIKESVPEGQLSKYGSDLHEGFNNLNVGLDDVQAVLAGPYFKGRVLVGIGKTEWRDIKWNDQSIAAKKNVINSAQFVFTAYEDTARWAADVQEPPYEQCHASALGLQRRTLLLGLGSAHAPRCVPDLDEHDTHPCWLGICHRGVRPSRIRRPRTTRPLSNPEEPRTVHRQSSGGFGEGRT